MKKDLNKGRQSLLDEPLKALKSGTNAATGMIRNFRDNFASMDGNQKLVAGATLLIGFAWFLNSKNDDVGKMRDVFKKALLLGVGYYAINTTSKVFLGKSLQDVAAKHIEKENKFLMDSFETNKKGAMIMNNALINLGDFDFDEIAKLYILAEDEYRRIPVADNLREISVGGVAEDNMSRNQIYTAMKMLDRKLNKQGTSIEHVKAAFERKRREAEGRGEIYPRPTLGLVIAAALQKDISKFKPNKEKKDVQYSKVEFDETQRRHTDKWWMVTGLPYNWKQQAYSPNKFPRKSVNEKNIKHISEDRYEVNIAKNKTLLDVINERNLGRYAIGFKELYKSQYHNKPEAGIVHKHPIMDGPDKNTVLLTSQVKIDYEAFLKANKTRNDARVASVANARAQAIKALKATPDFSNLPQNIQDRIHEFVQPVYGVFIKNDYVMFLRVVLPASMEFQLRKDKEWTDGDMIQMRKAEPMKTGESLTIDDFKILSAPTTTRTQGPISYGVTSEMRGCYESFLARFRLIKTQTNEINAVLAAYSNKFAGTGISKSGLARYLASHKFTVPEILAATGRTTLPLGGIDVEEQVRIATREAIDQRLNITVPSMKDEVNEEVMAGLGNTLVLACYGDLKAIEALKKINNKTLHASVAKTQFDTALNVLQAAIMASLSVPATPGGTGPSPAQIATQLTVLRNSYKEFIVAAYMARPWVETKKSIDSEIEEYRKI
jgi:hypothetical protein